VNCWPSFVSPLAGLVRRCRPPSHAEALLSRCRLISGMLRPRSRWLSRGYPGCFRWVAVESTEWAVVLRHACACSGLVTGIATCVAYSSLSHPRLYSPAGRQFTRIHCSFGPHLRLGHPQGRLTAATFASDYPSCYLSRGWTCSTLSPKIPPMLDARANLWQAAQSAPASSRACPAHFGIGTPLTGRPSHTTDRTDRVISGSAVRRPKLSEED
jgi:hypothetical protein